MFTYYAKFKNINGTLIRKNTRIYFTGSTVVMNEGNCLGIVIAKNPGSAKPKIINKWCELDLKNDKMLPNIAGMFYYSYQQLGYEFKKNDYVRILNLFKICTPDINEAIRLQRTKNIDFLEVPKRDLESTKAIFIAWGYEPKLDLFRKEWIQVLKRYESKCFYATHIGNRKYKAKMGIPEIGISVKHPQGLSHSIVCEKLTKLLVN